MKNNSIIAKRVTEKLLKPKTIWGLSSAGRASALQAEGHRFEPYRPHINRIWRNSSVGQSTRFIPVVSRVQISLPLLTTRIAQAVLFCVIKFHPTKKESLNNNSPFPKKLLTKSKEALCQTISPAYNRSSDLTWKIQCNSLSTKTKMTPHSLIFFFHIAPKCFLFLF